MNTTRPIWPDRHIPAPRIPKWFAQELWDFGGSNEFGAPNYRVIWAMDARTFRSGDPKAIKYPNPNDPSLGYACFWLERYAQPVFFNRTHWNALRYGPCEQGSGKTIDYLGPFPHRGDYIGIAPLIKDDDEGEPYEMLPLSRQLLEELFRRLSPRSLGADESAAGIVAAQHRLKKAKSAAAVDKKLDELNSHYRTNKERINQRATGVYSGLLTAVPESVRKQAAELSRQYTDKSGATHTLWQGPDGSGNAQIDFTA